MKKGISLGLAAMLMACGVASTSNNAAESATQRTRPKAQPQRPVVDDMRFDRGGMAGCFDPNLSGYARTAAEEIGGVPCDTPQPATTNSAASPSRLRIIGGWYASSGGWSATPDTCAGNGVTFENGGTYYAVNESGTWSLAGNILTLVATHETDGESDFPLRQPRRTIIRVSPMPGERMSWQIGNRPARVFMRCPQR